MKVSTLIASTFCLDHIVASNHPTSADVAEVTPKPHRKSLNFDLMTKILLKDRDFRGMFSDFKDKFFGPQRDMSSGHDYNDYNWRLRLVEDEFAVHSLFDKGGAAVDTLFHEILEAPEKERHALIAKVIAIGEKL